MLRGNLHNLWYIRRKVISPFFNRYNFMNKTFFNLLLAAVVISGANCAAADPADNPFISAIPLGITGTLSQNGDLNFAMANPFIDNTSPGNGTSGINAEPPVPDPTVNPFSFLTGDKNNTTNAGSDVFQQLQGTWLASDGINFLMLVFNGSNFTKSMNKGAASGTWQYSGSNITLFYNNSYKTHSFRIEGNNLTLDNGAAVLVRQNQPNTAPVVNNPPSVVNNPPPVVNNPPPVVDNLPSGSNPVTASQSINIEGRWNCNMQQGVFSFIFDGNTYRSLLNDIQVGGGTFYLNGNELHYNKTTGKGAGETGVDYLELNGNMLTITFKNGKYTFTKDPNFNPGRFSEQQKQALNGRWIHYGSTASHYLVFRFENGIYTMYENAKVVDRAKYEVSGSEIKLTFQNGSSTVWTFSISGNVLIINMPGISGPVRLNRG